MVLRCNQRMYVNWPYQNYLTKQEWDISFQDSHLIPYYQLLSYAMQDAKSASQKLTALSDIVVKLSLEGTNAIRQACGWSL